MANYITQFDDDSEMELIAMLNDPRKSLCQCLWYFFEKRTWHYPLKFEKETLLNKNYYGRIKKNEYNNMGVDILLPICIGLKLSLRFIEMFFKCSNYQLDYFTEPYRTALLMVEKFPGISIEDVNLILEKKNLNQFGSKLRI